MTPEQFQKAEQAKDWQIESPEYFLDYEGRCVHQWVRLGTAKDGTSFSKCRLCREECED